MVSATVNPNFVNGLRLASAWIYLSALKNNFHSEKKSPSENRNPRHKGLKTVLRRFVQLIAPFVRNSSHARIMSNRLRAKRRRHS
jgi:hypothetical protein